MINTTDWGGSELMFQSDWAFRDSRSEWHEETVVCRSPFQSEL